MKERLRALLGHPGLWLGDGTGAGSGKGVVPAGCAALDALLPGGGWPLGAVTEVFLSREGAGELRILLPAVAEAGRGGRWIAWIDPPYLLYAPALAALGVEASRVLVVGAWTGRDRLWAAEQCLRSGACGAVLAWLGECDERSLRRLQLAAERGGCLGFLFRPGGAADRFSPAPLRLRIGPSPGGAIVEILKGRGGEGRSAEVPLERSPAGAAAGAAPSGVMRPGAGPCGRFPPGEIHV